MAPQLRIDNLSIEYPAARGKPPVLGVNNVSLEIQDGESVGLVGESGCGKTTLGNAIVGLVAPTKGKILLGDQVIASEGGVFADDTRKRIQMVFQDPFASLNPRITVGSAILEVLKVHNPGKPAGEMEARMQELMKMVGLRGDMVGRYPHEFSGGQRQRIGIARALAVGPSLIIADEPVSALDVSIQAHILNLLKKLQKQMHLTYLFVAHDLAVVRYMCDRIFVMYLGSIVESASSDDLFNNPSHPYTEVLLSAIPDVEKGLKSRKSGSQRIVPKGDVPSGSERIKGCPFHPRCHKAQEKCSIESPPEKKVSDGHISRCHFS